jgi:Uma2 family endonuclease
MNVAVPSVISAEELLAMPDGGKRLELIRGEVVETMPPGGIHGSVAVKIALALELWRVQSSGGYVAVEAGYILAREPDTVRGPDVLYVRPDRIPSGGVPQGFWNIAPDLAVEVVSPSESAEDIREKVRDYLEAGTPLVWEAYPRTHEVLAHTPDGLARTFGQGDELAFPEVLPGFSCPVADLFV